MSHGISYVALDVSKKDHVYAIAGGPEPRTGVVRNEPGALRRFARKLVRDAEGDEVRVCYEAGVCGFALARLLEKAAPGLICEVIAPSLVPVRPGDRVKTDRRDARRLLAAYASEQLTVVCEPTEEEESYRALIRQRGRVQGDVRRTKHRIQQFCLQRCRVYSGTNWTQKYRTWVRSLQFEHACEHRVLDSLWGALEHHEGELRALQSELERVAELAAYAAPVGWLRCLYGIDTLTALILVLELYQFARFETPRQLMAFVGLVPSERSTAERTRRGTITKTGNSFVRRAIVEVTKNLRHRPVVGRPLRARRDGQPGWVIAIADKAHQRLYRRGHRLRERGLPANKISVALARELTGFVWAVLREGYHRQRAMG